MPDTKTDTKPIAPVDSKASNTNNSTDGKFSFSALFSVFGAIAETIGSIFTSGDKVKIAQTEVDKAREAVNAIKAQGDIEQTKLAEKALDLKLAQYNVITAQNNGANSLSKTKIIGWVILGIVFMVVLLLGYKFWTKKPNQVQYKQYLPPRTYYAPNNSIAPSDLQFRTPEQIGSYKLETQNPLVMR